MRIIIIALFSLFIELASLNAFASTNTALVNGLSSCMKLPNDEQRLVCFDKLAQNNITSLSATKVSDEVVSQSEQVKSEEAKKIDDFSKENLIKTDEERGPDNITATISNVKKLIRGQWIMDLENGQKWQQKDSAKIKLKVGDSIRLQKGAMGAVYLFKEGSRRNIRVMRLK